MDRRERLKVLVIVAVLLLEPGFLIWHATTPGNTVIFLPPKVALGLGAAALVAMVWWYVRAGRKSDG